MINAVTVMAAPMQNPRQSLKSHGFLNSQNRLHLCYEMYREGQYVCLHDSHVENKKLTYIWCYNNIIYDVYHWKRIEMSEKKIFVVFYQQECIGLYYSFMSYVACVICLLSEPLKEHHSYQGLDAIEIDTVWAARLKA